MDRLRSAIGQVCSALAYVHAHGLVHRDLKPSNIMVDDDRRVRLMDFGLVKLAGESVGLTLHGKVVGTYRYMSPEQARGRPVDARSDLYSLGVILFELLCGRAPFLAERPHDLWHDIVERPPPAVASLNPGADPRLALVAERLLQKDPAERFQRADDVAAVFY
jgi:serine/threonine protein kinase